jgi:SAM-dependent methyltransferase
MISGFDELRRGAASYYGAKLREHGPTARGVDWNSSQSQVLRFDRLLEVVDRRDGTLLDYGCGYGALADHLVARGDAIEYCGYDVAAEMIEAARERRPGTEFTSERASLVPADFAVASGVFNVKQAATSERWLAYVLETIDELARLGRRGFAFNLLTAYSDDDRKRPDLFYGDPLFFFDHCARRFARLGTALLQDYGLFEFTVIVRRALSVSG